MLKLYEGSTSVCAIKVRLALFEKEIPFESCPIDLRAGDQFNPEYLKLNPKGVVPTLVDNSTPIVESSIIMQYVEDKHPERSLLPAEPFDRARMRLWMKRIDDEVHPSTGNLTFATVHRNAFLALDATAQSEYLAKIPDADRRQRRTAVFKEGLDAPIVVGSVKQFGKLITDMESALGDAEYLAGDAYSLADAAMTPYVNRLSDLGLLQLWAESAPLVLGWFDAIKARGSFAQGVTEYLTENDKTAFDAIDPTTPQRVAHILDGT